ncbi:DMT family transporter [Pseudoalteromonas sp. S2755]|uniref:EamA family transporter n=1 Tax=Pseudoalteromonas sp. S2755 TaxID=2066523 RepID=UPI00110A1BDB|nr:DMT family transporter [Pseudoalteromonas sp. S2755]TMN32991.1 EamA family transporter [Pseudoalteromonas sp. S2755]
MPLLSRDFVIAILCLLCAMVTIQSGASIAKQLFPFVGPEGTTAYRLGFSALILCLVFKPWRHLPVNWRPLIVYGLCLGGMNITFYYAIERIPIGIGVALEFTGPLAVALFSSKRKRDYLWVAFAILGILLLLPDLGDVNGLDPVGVALALVAGACWAGYILYGKRSGNESSGGVTVAIGMTVAALAIVPFGMVSQGAALLDWSLIPLGIAIGLLSSALPYSLEMVALRKMPAQGFSILMSVEPAVAALAGFLILGELLTVWQWLAIFMVITASVGSSVSSKE